MPQHSFSTSTPMLSNVEDSFMPEGHTLVSEANKVDPLFSFFGAVLGMSAQRPHTIKLSLLDLPHIDLLELGGRFTE
jgi:hypothetical protein